MNIHEIVHVSILVDIELRSYSFLRLSIILTFISGTPKISSPYPIAPVNYAPTGVFSERVQLVVQENNTILSSMFIS